MKLKYGVLILSLMMMFPVHAEFTTMRCGTKLVSVGERNFEVYRKCGEPAFRNFVGYTGDGNAAGYLPIEEWVYNQSLGSRDAYNLLRFEGGKLIAIESHLPTN